MCDNQSCIKLSENPIFHDRWKHIDIRCHFVRDCVQQEAVQLRYTPTGEQVADILTKALGRTKFVSFREKMGMVKNPFRQQKWISIGSCSAAVSNGSAMGSMMQHIQRELQYRCSSDSCSVMGNSAVVEGQRTNAMDQCGASIRKHYQSTFLAKREC